MKRRAGAGAACPCGSGRDYAGCCGRWHAGEAAPDADALMRSRYCAYVRGLHTYLCATWHPDTRPPAGDLVEATPTQWLGLTVRQHVPSGDTAIVEFVARYKLNGRAGKMHERCRFARIDGRWYYVDGDERG